MKEIESGLPIISGKETNRIGRLGLLAGTHKSDNSIYALSFRRVLKEGPIYLDSDETPKPKIGVAGKLGAVDFTVDTPPLIDSLVSWFEIDSSCIISPTCTVINEKSKLCTPAEAFGKKVKKVGENGNESAWGIVDSICATVGFLNPDSGELEEFTNVIKVIPSSDDESKFSDYGDAGAVVITDDGGIVGLIIGHSKNKSYIAPLYDVFKKEQFELLDRETVNRHNTVALSNNSLLEQLGDDLISKVRQTPENWTTHIANIRPYFHSIHSNVNSEKYELQEITLANIGVSVCNIIPLSHIASGLSKLNISKSLTDPIPSDHWFYWATCVTHKCLGYKDGKLSRIDKIDDSEELIDQKLIPLQTNLPPQEDHKSNNLTEA